MWGIERNKDPELPMKQRNTSWFVILDDRKHGRAGKFPVFYDIDTGDYLEPPEGFLDSPYETLREWYAAHPADDPSHSSYQEPRGTNVQPLSSENQDKTGSDLTEDDIPPADENFMAALAESEAKKEVVQEDLPLDDVPPDVPDEPEVVVETTPEAVENRADVHYTCNTAPPEVPDVPEDDWDDAVPF